MTPAVLDFPAIARPRANALPSAERFIKTRQAAAETAIAELRRHRLRGAEYNDDGMVMWFRIRDAAVCARALLVEHKILHATCIYGAPGRWRVAGAWLRPERVGGDGRVGFVIEDGSVKQEAPGMAAAE